MGKRRKNRLSQIIRYELICLAAVSLIVFGIVRWSEGVRNAAQTEAKPGNAAGKAAGAPSVPGASDMDGASDTDGADGNLGGKTLGKNEAGEDGSIPAGNKASDDIATPGGEEGQNPAGNAGVASEGEGSQTPSGNAEPTQGEAATPAPTKTPEGSGVAAGQAEPNGGNDAIAANPDMDMDFINSLSEPQSGEILEAKGAVRTVYYLQHDERWGSMIYGGEDTLAKYACGPTSMAIVVSSLTNIGIDPVQMSGWAYDNGYWYDKSGSLHTIVNGTAKAFGLKSEGVGNDSATAKKVIENLKSGGMAVVLMGKGHFTKSGHFIVLRGITEDGKILVADCNSRDNTMEEWDMATIQAEAKYAADGGPFWNIWVPNTIE